MVIYTSKQTFPSLFSRHASHSHPTIFKHHIKPSTLLDHRLIVTIPSTLRLKKRQTTSRTAAIDNTSTAMDVFNEFCLECDRQTISGPYCSQACRLADLERASACCSSASSPSSPSMSPSFVLHDHRPTLSHSASRTSLTSLASTTSSTSSSWSTSSHQVQPELKDYFDALSAGNNPRRRSYT